MKERGILFRDRLVRRILDAENPKTQTRRIIKPQPFTDTCASSPMIGNEKLAGLFAPHVFGACMAQLVPSPYGVPGDRLWVREAWRSWTEQHHDHHTEDEPCDEHCKQVYVAYRSTPRQGFRPTPDRQIITYLDESTPLERNANLLCPWKPGIHLRRDHARIVLDIVAIRVERLQDISDADAIAEGVELGVPLDVMVNGEPSKAVYFDARTAFAHLWCSVHGDGPKTIRGTDDREIVVDYSWKANPWVWVVEFRRVEPRWGIKQLIDGSSIGAGLRNIEENGIEAELADLDEELHGL